MNEASTRITFDWREAPHVLSGLVADGASLSCSKSTRAFVGDLDGRAIRYEPPALVPIGGAEETVDIYLERYPETLGLQYVLLMQAGAVAMGLWRESDLLRHKCITKYVVRGKGRAQPLYSKTKGKSRYGSRLRLHNAKALLVETNEKTLQWWKEEGRFDRIYFNCPQRLWPELFLAKPPPPFPQRDEPMRLPFDVHEPRFDELKRIRRKMLRGSWTTQQ